ncbi:linear amide C-N hydrolase [Flavobacterium sp. '19STA2R22 D10 B1']|uniref:linear amide C-N hydrolase n=1 Tax=Flavobacterium aerium TaxID=3037261 RepID=UPI00278C168D|nr:linear amide C-N hydrolase [Flavobacterium sp. '19STA2R22 D10 B1']
MSKTKGFLFLFLFCTVGTLTSVNNYACTRFVYTGTNNTVLTARSMDWATDIGTNLWVFPRGINRNGEVNGKTIKWKSKYGSLIASAFDISTSDGMNEKGLVANLLWLAESEYGDWNPKKPSISISIWAQYILDNFATVKEAVLELEKEKFALATTKIPGTDKTATVHLAISDASGDSAIFEYVKGKLMIHHDSAYQVMTNSPIFDKQLALNAFWNEIPGTMALPGTNKATDRFVRASFYVNAIPKVDDTRVAVASVFSVIRNCSVPYGITTKDQPNISSTRWRTVSDHKNKVYYFESTLSPNVFWVDFKDLNFGEKEKVKMLSIVNQEIYSGNAADKFVDTNAFAFAGVQ